MFNVGDKVQWYSQAGGSTTLKQGEIVMAVPPGQAIEPVLDELIASEDGPAYNVTKLYNSHGNARRRISYLVAVRQTGDARPVVYWPVAERLIGVDSFLDDVSA